MKGRRERMISVEEEWVEKQKKMTWGSERKGCMGNGVARKESYRKI